MKEVLSEEKTSNQDDFREIGVSLHASQQRRYTMVDLLDELVNDPTDDSTDDKIYNLKGDDLIKIREEFLDSEKCEHSEDSEHSGVFEAPRQLLSLLVLPKLISYPSSKLSELEKKKKKKNHTIIFPPINSDYKRLQVQYRAFFRRYDLFSVITTYRPDNIKE